MATVDMTEFVDANGNVGKFKDEEAREQLIKTKEVTIGPSTDGHVAPVQSGGGVYYERLANFSALGVDQSKIISIGLVGWGDVTHSFTLYTTSTTLSCMFDNSSSIYRQSTSYLTIRITYKGI